MLQVSFCSILLKKERKRKRKEEKKEEIPYIFQRKSKWNQSQGLKNDFKKFSQLG